MDIWIPWTVHLVMVLFGYGPIWTWSYLGSTKNVQKKISPSEHAQIHPVRPIDIPTRGHNRQSPKINRHQTLTTAAARDLRRNRSLSLNVLHSIHGGEERDSNQRETNRKRTAIPFDRSTDTKNSSIYRR